MTNTEHMIHCPKVNYSRGLLSLDSETAFVKFLEFAYPLLAEFAKKKVKIQTIKGYYIFLNITLKTYCAVFSANINVFQFLREFFPLVISIMEIFVLIERVFH
jgi:hypothetical protein